VRGEFDVLFDVVLRFGFGVDYGAAHVAVDVGWESVAV
jgi:hypothetical protein